MRSAIRIAIIVLLATGAAFVRARVDNLPWIPDVEAIEQQQQAHQRLRETVGITLDEFRELVEQGAVVIDARPAEEFEQGHLDTGSVPPCLNVPPDTLEDNLDRLMQLQGFPIVLYCTSLTCDFAEELYLDMERYGFFNMKIYFPGWEGILQAGLPTTSGPDTWTGFDEPNDPNRAPDANDAVREAQMRDEPNG